MPTATTQPAMLIGLGLYGVVALLFMRDDGLRGRYRIAYALLVFPTFLGLSFLCIGIADSLYPDLLPWLSTFNGGNAYLNSLIERAVSLLVASAIPFVLCSTWYYAFRRMSH